MVQANRRLIPLLGLTLALLAGSALAAQTCKYDSIRATAPASRFTDNGNGTVTDKATGLQWKRCGEGQTWSGSTCTGSATGHTWQAALQLADGASYAGHSDWRLPNIKELASIIERACDLPPIDLGVFPGTPSDFFWSSSPYAVWASRARSVGSIGNGYGGYDYKSDDGHVRLVRGGQALVSGASNAGVSAATAPTWPLNDTGLDWWADGTTNFLTSPPAGYPGQDASYGRDATQDNDADGHAGFSFTKLSATGAALPASASSWSCVRDNVTGLIWEVKTDDGGLRDKDWGYSWYNPDPSTNGGSAGYPDYADNCYDPARCDTHKFAADVNAQGLCGAGDWRLPTVEELRSLVDYSRSNPAIDTAFFPDVGPYYWSSLPRAIKTSVVWFVSFKDGDVGDASRFSGQRVRLVRGGQAVSFDLPTPIRVTNAAGLWVREGPGTQWPILNEIGNGQEFVAFDRSTQGDDLWYRIWLPCGNTCGTSGACSGWVAGRAGGKTYAVEAPASTQLAVVNTAPLGLNIRAVPNGSVRDSAYDGQRFVTFASQSVAGSGCGSPWYRIYLPTSSYAESGWVCGDYVQLIGSGGTTGTLEGRVTRGGAALAGVGLTLSGAAADSTSSNASGAYAFAGLGNGSYTLTPALANHIFSPANRAVSLAGVSRGGLDFRACDTAAPLTGTLVDATSGSPLVGVSISANGSPAATTGAGGAWSIPGLACGTHPIGVTLGGYAPYQRSVDRFAQQRLDIRLIRESTTNGLPPNTGILGDPVNTATGNYVYQRRDLEIPGIGLPLRFDRSYNSREASGPGAVGAPLGFGWTHSYQARLAVSAGVVTLTWGDGHTETHTPDGSGGYTPQYGVFDSLSANGDGSHRLTKRDRTRYDFDTSGRLAAISDKNGNTQTLTYTGTHLTQIQDTAGRLISLDYDGNGRITQVTDPIGRTLVYRYDTSGNLIEAADPEGNLTQYSYDGEHQILTVVDPRSHTVVNNSYDAARRVVTYQTDAKGYPISYAYQELDRVTTITDALNNVTVHHHDELLRLTQEVDARGGVALYEYDAAGNRIKVTDKNGNVTQYGYDARGNVTSKTDALGQVTAIAYDVQDNPTSRTDALGNLTQFAYDANGNLIKTTDGLGHLTEISYWPEGLPKTVKDARGNVTTNSYDAEGNLTQVTNALGKTTAHTYDGVGRRLTTTDALGRVTRFAYDANDNLLTLSDALGGVVTHAFDANDNKTSTTDRNGNLTQWAYDEKDLRVSETDALGQVEIATYDALDRRISRTDRRGFTTQYAYDAVGNLVKIRDALGNETTYTYDLNGNRLSQTDARGHTTRYSYDALNRRTNVKDPLGNEVLTEYDALGRVVKVTAPGGRITRSHYDALGRLTQVTNPEGGITQFAYDANGNRVSTTDPRGNATASTYDALNRLVQVTDALGHSTQSAYDAVGNRVSVTDALGHAASFGYDALNRQISQADALGNTSTTAYDAGGRVISATDAAGKTTAFAYDALDRLTQVTDAAGGTVVYAYDKNGNRTAMTDPNGHVTTYTYDALNRRTQMTEPLGHLTSLVHDEVGNPIQKTDPKGQVIGYSYDALKRRTGIDYPAQPDVVFTYDAVGNLLSMTDGLGTTTHAYDLLDRRLSTTDPFGQPVGYGYDANGNRVSLTYPGGKTVTYIYDAANRMTSVTDWLGNVTGYSYDAANRLTGTLNANGTTAAYAYDAADRLSGLTNAKSDTTVINAYSYTLDAVGNHLSEDRTEPLTPLIPAEVVTDTHDDENRLTVSNGVPNSFDANGNLTAKGADTYTYDTLDRLIQTDIGGTQTQYGYDGLGNRYKRIRGGAETRFVLDTNTALTNVLMETDTAGNPLAYNLYGQGLIARILPDNSRQQYHYDSRGSTIAITDGAGTALRQYAYDPFGQIANTNGTEANPFGFLGRHGVIDEGKDLSYIRARYYDAEQQRFISKDAKSGGDRWPQTRNRYAYSINNPVNMVDVSGYSPIEGQTPSGVNITSDLDNQDLVDGAVGESTSSMVAELKEDWCGSGGSKWVPEVFPIACKIHDVCYEGKGGTRKDCDNQFLRNMMLEKPLPLLVEGVLSRDGKKLSSAVVASVEAFYYWGAVRILGGEAYSGYGFSTLLKDTGRLWSGLGRAGIKGAMGIGNWMLDSAAGATNASVDLWLDIGETGIDSTIVIGNFFLDSATGVSKQAVESWSNWLGF